MIMIARGGAMAAMGYLPVEPAAQDKNGDAEILAPANHDCQHTFPISLRPGMRRPIEN
jgi:hypothetical protein